MRNLDAYKLKWIAMTAMLLNHMVIAWWEIMPLWLSFPFYAAGGLTFPVLAYFVAQGYRHTSGLGRYILRLFIFGLAAMPFGLMLRFVKPMMPAAAVEGEGPWLFGLNIMFSIILSLAVLVLYDKMKSRALFWVMYVILIVPISTLFFEWGFFGVTMVLLYHIIRNERARKIVPPVFAAVCWIFNSLIARAVLPDMDAAAHADGLAVSAVFFIGCLLAIPLLLKFNGERGKRMKWTFYVFYPLHFAALAAVALALGLVDLSVIGI